MIDNRLSNIELVEETNYSVTSDNIDIWNGDFPFKEGDIFPTEKIKNRADISKTNRLLYNNDYKAILNKLLDVIPEIDPMYGYQIKEVVANIPYFKVIVDGFVSLCCSPKPIIDSPDNIDERLSNILENSNIYSTLEYRFRSLFMDVIDVYVVKKNKQGKAIIQTIPVKNCIIYNDAEDVSSVHCIEVFNIVNNQIEFIDYFWAGRIEKRTFQYTNGTIGKSLGEVEKSLAYNGKYPISPAGFITHNTEFPGDTYGVDQFRNWDSTITIICRELINLFRINEKGREIIRKVPESSLSRTFNGTYAFINKGTISYPDGLDSVPEIEYIIPQLKDNIEACINTLNKATKILASSSGLSHIWFDFEKLGTNLSAKSLKAAMLPTILHADMLCDNMTDSLKQIVQKIALLYDIELNKSDIDINWFSGIDDDTDKIDYVNKRIENKTMSYEDAIVYLDRVSRRTAKERIEKLNGIKTDNKKPKILDDDTNKEADKGNSIDFSFVGKEVDDTTGKTRDYANPNIVPDYQMPILP